MAQTLQSLYEILEKAVPTVILLLLLYFYFKAMLFKPLNTILKQRDELTRGARKTAEDSLANAERKTQDFEIQLRDARSEVYREQEEQRRTLLEDQAAQIAQAHERTSASISTARAQIAAEAAVARESLAAESGLLADQIATSLLTRRSQ